MNNRHVLEIRKEKLTRGTMRKGNMTCVLYNKKTLKGQSTYSNPD